MEKRKIIKLGKIDFYGTGRKINAVELELNLRDWNKYEEFTVCASVWNIKHTDCVCCGQCLDELLNFPAIANNPTFKTVHRLWKLYHFADVQKMPSEDRELIYEYFPGGLNG